MVKKSLSILLALVILLSVFTVLPITVNAEDIFTSGDYQYRITDNGTAEITKYKGIGGDVEIPSSLNGTSVTSIGKNAFSNCDNLKKIDIPSTVTEIGEYAFANCDSLTSLTLPEGVTLNGESFGSCSGLTSITIPKGVWYSTDIYTSRGPFDYCENLRQVTFADGSTSVPKYLFTNCTALTKVYFPDSITFIGDKAFADCESLTHITLPTGLTETYSSYGSGPFVGCNISSVTIKDGTKTLPNGIFCDCTGITDIYIPDSVETIYKCAFYGCTGLTEIEIPKSIKYAGNDSDFAYFTPFYNCTNLKKAVIRDGATVIPMKLFMDCSNLETVTIPDTVTCIEKGAFNRCYNLKKIDIPSTVKEIGKNAFSGCDSLTSLTLPEGVTLNEASFGSCSGLTSITIPKGVWYSTDIYTSRGPFDYCENLRQVTFADGSTSVPKYLFTNCTALTKVYFPDSITFIGDKAFADCESLTHITLPTGLSETYSAYGSGPFVGCNISSVTIKDGTKILPNGIFCNCTGITDIYIPDSVETIYKCAFYGCTGLTEIEIPKSIKYAGNDSDFAYFTPFYNCTNLKKAVIRDGATIIPMKLFMDCSNLETVTIPDTVTCIEKGAFNRCYNLKKIDIPSTVKEIGKNAFSGCDSLTSLTLPEGVTLNEASFGSCSGLTSITIPKGVWYSTDIYTSRGPFDYCENLRQVAFADGSTSVPRYMFTDCTALTDVIIPDSITDIGYGAFMNCEEITDVWYAGSKSDWDRITINSENNYLTDATIHYNSSAPVHDAPSMYCLDAPISEIDVHFNKNWFFNDSSSYNHNIARLSSQMLLEGYIAEDNDMNGMASDLPRSLESLGFDPDDIEIDLNTERDQMNYFIASKPIKSSGETYNLVYVGCIGSWHEQWNSNFDPRGKDSKTDYPIDNNNHRGFDDAKNFIYSKLYQYIGVKGFNKSNTKILLTGHSRGAATANLLAAKLIDDNAIVSPSNLFTYTFASPNCTKNSARSSSRYNRIFNIVFPTDFVTKVLPASWGYGRYGTTYSLPTKTNDKDWLDRNYNHLKGKMMEKYEILNQATEGSKEFHDYALGEADLYAVVTVFSASVWGLDDYYNQKYTWSSNVSMSPFSYFQSGLCPLVNHTSTKYGNSATALGVMATPLTGNSILYKDLSAFFIANANQKLSKFQDAHKMETYCAFMLGLSSAEVTAPRKGFLGSVNCPVDVEIIDKTTGEVVGRIVNNVVDEEIAAKDNAVVMTVNGDQKQYWLPSNGDYEVILTGSDDGVMDYTVSEIDPDLGETARKNYFDVPLEEDKSYVCSAENEDPALYDLILTDEEEEEITPDEELTAEETAVYTVKTETVGSGSADGATTAASGDYITLTASPDRSDFIGWYRDDTLVSHEEEYRFRPTDDVTLTAKFTDAVPLLLGDADGDDQVMITDPTCIERQMVSLLQPRYYEIAADTDGDGTITPMDATYIQRWLANLKSNDNIGKPIT